MIIHNVFFSFKPNISKEKIEAMWRELLKMKDRIDCIEKIVYGENKSSEGLSKNFTHGFIIYLKNGSINDYLKHPTHKLFAQKFLIPIIQDALVFDFEA